jgi:tungstate transport system permease protein
MDFIWESLRDAVRILANNENDVYDVAWRSLYVSGVATFFSLIFGVSAGALLAFRQFPGKLIAMSLVNTGMGLPPVVVGLFISFLVWRSGPLGDLGWAYSTKAMIIGQVIIATPVITGFTAASLASLHPKLRLQVYALGASRLQMLWLLLQEVRLPLLAALMAGFGAAISEVGASVMVGGNVRGETRVLTGTILLEHSKGHFEVALALGLILLAMMIAVNMLFTWVQYRRRGDARNNLAARTAETAPYAAWLTR